VTIGVLGGGQLGRMLALAGHQLPKCTVLPLDPLGEASPAGQVSARSLKGSFTDPDAIEALAKECDLLTVEIEHVNCDALDEVVKKGTPVFPTPDVIRLIQDKLRQKQHFEKCGVPVGPFADIPDLKSALAFGKTYGFPYMLKARRGAYDGRGNRVVLREADVMEAFDAMAAHGGDGGGCYAEKWANFSTEAAVIAVRDARGVECYPVVDFVSYDSQLLATRCPAFLPASIVTAARDVALNAIQSLPDGAYGVFGVEMFVLESGEVWLNEVAPRVHNTGHYTIEACGTSQFTSHLLALLSLADKAPVDFRRPQYDCQLRVGAAVMVNLIGKEHTFSAGSLPRGGTLHDYGKAEVRTGRKMAHVTVCGTSHAAIYGAMHRFTGLTDEYIYPTGPETAPMVGVIMGSKTDLPTMQAAVDILKEYGISHEVTVVSAHRTPDRMYRYATDAVKRGLRVIIAGAGGAAHLPGMVAAMTPLPVIGVPVKTSTMSGLDSLYSIVQMPRGVPVATVAIGNAKNAGILACEIIGGGGRLEELLRLRADKMEATRVEVEKGAAEDFQEWVPSADACTGVWSAPK